MNISSRMLSVRSYVMFLINNSIGVYFDIFSLFDYYIITEFIFSFYAYIIRKPRLKTHQNFNARTEFNIVFIAEIRLSKKQQNLQQTLKHSI